MQATALLTQTGNSEEIIELVRQLLEFSLLLEEAGDIVAISTSTRVRELSTNALLTGQELIDRAKRDIDSTVKSRSKHNRLRNRSRWLIRRDPNLEMAKRMEQLKLTISMIMQMHQFTEQRCRADEVELKVIRLLNQLEQRSVSR